MKDFWSFMQTVVSWSAIVVIVFLVTECCLKR